MTRRLRTELLALAALVATAGVVQAEAPPAASPSEPTRLRVAYTASVFRDVAESDARAAIKVWTEAASREMSIPVTAEVQVLSDPERLVRLVESGGAEFCGMTTFEFLPLEQRLTPDPIFVVSRDGSPAVEYLLLVRNDSGVNRLADLRQTDLAFLESPLTSLALPWLDVSLAENGLPDAAGFFARIGGGTKLSAVVLPVFFGSVKACLVTRQGFQTMVELNPQLGHDLRIFAQSPSVVPLVSFIRRDYRPPFRQELIDSISRMHRTAAGRQILNMVQGTSMQLLPSTELDSARELLRRWNHRATQAAVPHGAGSAHAKMTRGAGK